MRAFMDTALGPRELAVIDQAFNDWLTRHHVSKNAPGAERAAAIIMTLYREGNNGMMALEAAMAMHRGLIDRSNLAAGS